MKQDESLTRSAFLLAFDLRKGRLTGRGELGYLLRAAALSELLLAGHLADDSGKVRALTAPAAHLGALPAAVYEQIAAAPPRKWGHWVTKDGGKAVRLVRDELVAARLIGVERRRILFFPVERITPRKPYLSRRLAERVAQAIRGGRPVDRLELDVRVLAALGTAARHKAVPTHGRKERIQQLSEPVEPIATALRKSVDAARSSHAAG
ncbi:GOLPH3/VPS74 family protein [Nonomuraea solani]|uniref:GOLPH3/VPS74 family protein n=1 Tax=Nonomuraea solani TaxID=1144553 RepID=UPI00135B364A|nr:GPP34 family phosphoprotein [Nonomuraea solani]